MWIDGWPPNLPPETRVRATMRVQIAPGVLSYTMTVEDTARAFTEFMARRPERSYDEFATDALPLSMSGAPVGGTWSGRAEDFFV